MMQGNERYVTQDEMKVLNQQLEHLKLQKPGFCDDEQKKQAIQKIYKMIDIKNYVINPPNDYAVISLLKPGEKFERRFYMLSLLFFLKNAMNEIKDVDHPKHMTDDELLVIDKFIDNIFTFNKQQHANHFGDKNYNKPGYKDYVENQEDLQDLYDDDKTKAVEYPFACQVDKSILEVDDDKHYIAKLKGMQVKIPTMNSFNGWQQFMKYHYDDIKNITHLFEYNDPTMQWGLNIHQSFKTLEEAKKFIERHYEKYPIDLHITQQGMWTICDESSKNQQALELLGDKTKVIKEIIDASIKDQQHIPDLLKERVKQANDHNLRSQGLPSDFKKEFYQKLCEGDIPVTLLSKDGIFSLNEQFEKEQLEKEQQLTQQQ